MSRGGGGGGGGGSSGGSVWLWFVEKLVCGFGFLTYVVGEHVRIL